MEQLIVQVRGKAKMLFELPVTAAFQFAGRQFISNTIWYVLAADGGKKQKQAGEGGTVASNRIVDGLLP